MSNPFLLVPPPLQAFKETDFNQVEFLIDAGADTQITNKHGDKPLDLVAERNQVLKDALMKADLADLMGGDIVALDDLDEDVVSD